MLLHASYEVNAIGELMVWHYFASLLVDIYISMAWAGSYTIPYYLYNHPLYHTFCSTAGGLTTYMKLGGEAVLPGWGKCSINRAQNIDHLQYFAHVVWYFVAIIVPYIAHGQCPCMRLDYTSSGVKWNWRRISLFLRYEAWIFTS